MLHLKIISDIKSKKISPVYLLHGEEPYYIDKILDAADKFLTEDEKAFNFTVFYGKDSTVSQIVDTARRLPMMSEFQVVIVREGQELDGKGELESYILNPSPQTLFIFAHMHKKLDGNRYRKLLTAFKKKGEVAEFKKVYDNKIPEWIEKYVKSKKRRISNSAIMLISENLGVQLSKIENELNKVFVNIKEGEEITPQFVEKYIGFSKDYNFFELNKALAFRDVEKSFKIVKHFSSNIKIYSIQGMVAVLFSFFKILFMYKFAFAKTRNDNDIAKLLGVRSAWFIRNQKVAAKKYSLESVENIIHLLKEYDEKGKGINDRGKSPGGLMEELVYKILNS